MLILEAVNALPGFLYFYFWEGAGLPFSAFIGFLLGNFVLSVLEGLDQVLGAVRRLLGMGDGAKKGRVRAKETAAVPGAEGEQRQRGEISRQSYAPETRQPYGSTLDKRGFQRQRSRPGDPPLHADTPNKR